jgi:hypothetical protein
MLKLMASSPALLLASTVVWRREPEPLSLVVVTV